MTTRNQRPPRRLNRDRIDWALCKKCGSRHPPESYITADGVARKTCAVCRASRNKRKLQACRCNKCLHCRERRKAEANDAQVGSPKYSQWELLGGDKVYLMLHTKPLTEIAKLYEYTT